MPNYPQNLKMGIFICNSHGHWKIKINFPKSNYSHMKENASTFLLSITDSHLVLKHYLFYKTFINLDYIFDSDPLTFLNFFLSTCPLFYFVFHFFLSCSPLLSRELLYKCLGTISSLNSIVFTWPLSVYLDLRAQSYNNGIKPEE